MGWPFVADDWWFEQIKLAAVAQDDLPDKRMGCQALHADSRGYLSLPILHLDYGWSWVSKYEYEVSKQFQQQFAPNICTILRWFASQDSGCPESPWVFQSQRLCQAAGSRAVTAFWWEDIPCGCLACVGVCNLWKKSASFQEFIH